MSFANHTKMRSSRISSESGSIDPFTTEVTKNQQLLSTIPTDALASRRLSQTNVRASLDMSINEPKDLHKWAAEALTARPETNIAPPLESLSNSTSSLISNGRRESEAGVSWTSKSSAPPVGGNFAKLYANEMSSTGTSYDTIPRFHTPNHLELAGTSRRDNFLSNGLRERPSSMFAVTSPTSDTSFALQMPEINANEEHIGQSSTPAYHQATQRHPSLKSCLKSYYPTVEDDKSETPTALHSMASQSSLNGNNIASVQKSVHISDDLPRLKESIESSSRSSSPVSSPMASRLVRRNAAHKRNVSENRSSRRSFSSGHQHSHTHSHNSPTLTEDTTCESEEEDGVAVVTPMDEDGPSEQSSKMKNAGSFRGTSGSKNDEKDGSRIAAPFLSRATLLDIGREEGLTPPTMQDDNHRSQVADLTGTSSDALSHVISPTSVVSAGLGMGLGARMGPSTFSAQLPQTSSSEMNSIMEARYDRFAGQMDFNALAMSGLKLTEAQNDFISNAKGKSDRAADEVTFAELDRDDAELNRRRTTGGLQSRREVRSSGVVGKRRVHRTGTQDPHGSHMNDIEEGSASADSSNLSATHSSPFAGAQQMHGTTSTPLDTPSHGHKALLSPSIEYKAESGSYHSRFGDDHRGFTDRARETNNEVHDKFAQPAIGGAYNLDGGLMGIGEVGHFGPGVRAKVSEVIEAFIGTIPLSGMAGETVNMMEYGALNSRSGSLLRPAISSLAKRAMAKEENGEEEGSKDNFDQSYFQGRQHRTAFQEPNSLINFCVTHEDAPSTDFRAMTQMLETHRDSYLNAHWQAKHSPCLTNTVFPSFAARPFASRLAPPNTMHLGISLMDMHWTHTPNNVHVSRATTAQAELTAFLNSRSNEFKKDGLLFMAYIARSDEPIRPSLGPNRLSSDPMMTDDDNSAYSISPIEKNAYNITNAQAFRTPKKDIWTTLSNTLAPCIQRLVSCGMLKSDVARHLLDLPMHPRTAKQTKAALKSVEDKWKLEWSCGLGQNDKEDSALSLANEPTPLRLVHPAWKAFDSGCLSRVPFTEHMIQLFKNLYECHFRNVLREKGRLSKGAVEFVLDSLWDALFSRIADDNSSTAKDIEIEVCIYALRRR